MRYYGSETEKGVTMHCDKEPTTVLNIENLSVSFFLYGGVLNVLDDVCFITVKQHEMFGLVGESGSGKTVSALSVMKLLEPPGRVVSGYAWFENINLLSLNEKEIRKIRGSKISMIFQDAKSCLNPFMKIGDQVSRVFRIHRNLQEDEAEKETIYILEKMGISDPKNVRNYYPHQLSGGMAQRVMIAIMMSCRPELLIADEPTPGLDVTTQSELMDLMKRICKEGSPSIWLITHDLGVVAQNCDRVSVMHAGHVVESGDVNMIFNNPLHPYTQGLIKSVPLVDKRVKVSGIPGQVPSFLNPPTGCRFASRCPYKKEKCVYEKPKYSEPEPKHLVMCHLFN